MKVIMASQNGVLPAIGLLNGNFSICTRGPEGSPTARFI